MHIYQQITLYDMIDASKRSLEHAVASKRSNNQLPMRRNVEDKRRTIP